MRNLKRWKRLMAVAMCSAMMFSVPMGVSATDDEDTDKTPVVETTETETEDKDKETDKPTKKDEIDLPGDSGTGANSNDTTIQSNTIEVENAKLDDSTTKEIETQEDSGELPAVNWNGEFTLSHAVDSYNTYTYTLVLGEEWEMVDDHGTYGDIFIDGAKYRELTNTSVSQDNRTINQSFSPNMLAFHPLEITYKIDKLAHYNNGVMDGVAKDVEISFKTEVVDDYDFNGKAHAIPTYITYDGSQDLVFKFQDGVGDYAIKNLADEVEFWTAGFYLTTKDFTYDTKAGELRVPYYVLNEEIARRKYCPSKAIEVKLKGFTYQNGQVCTDGKMPVETGSGIWKVECIANDWSSNGDMPEFINTSHEFDGTQDMVFNFKNGTGDNEIKVVKEVFFPIKEKNAMDENGMYLAHFRIGNYGTSFNYDIAKGQVTLYKHAVSAIVYGKWRADSNVYGGGFMVVELANGKTRTLYVSDGDTDWEVKVLKKSLEATGQHVVDVTEGVKEFNVEQMQGLVDINKNVDVVLRTPEGITFTFAKGAMRMVDGKDGYPFGVDIIADFSNSGIKNSNVTSDIFACRINFEYSGELPGTAKISIPVDNKWNGKTLYYYQVMADGTLVDTGKSGEVKDGIFDVFQSHCSDYVLLAKSPSELGIASVNGQVTNTNSNGNTSTKVTSPKTGDTTTVLLFVFLCMGACLVGTGAIAVRRKSN